MISNFVKILLLLFVFTQYAVAQDENLREEIETGITQLTKDLNEVGDQYSSAQAIYLSPLVLNSEYETPVEKKIMKAEFYFNKKDYISSGSLYYSIVMSRIEKDSIWEESLFKLAESLYRNRNYISAKRYFEMLINTIPESKHRIECLKRLISSSYHLGEYSSAKKYYLKFIEIGYDMSKDQELIYFLGKSLFFDEQIQEAVNVFKTINDKSAYFPQSQYFIGSILLKAGKDKEALVCFEKVISLSDEKIYFKFEKIRDLALLAAARIAFEMDNLNLTLKYYLMLDKSSKHFAEAYYELCWTYIKKEEYLKAINALRLIKYIAPDSIIAPKAEILEGSLLIKMERFGEAMMLFDSVVKKYGVIKEELYSIDSKDFYSKAKRGDTANALSPYSPIVRSLLSDNKKFTNAMILGDDITVLEKEINIVKRLEKKISTIIENKNISTIFPPLKEGSRTVIFLQNRIVSIKSELLTLRKKVFWNLLSKAEKDDYDQLENKKRKLLGIIEETPLTSDQIKKKAFEYAKKIIEMEGTIHRITIQTKSLFDQLDAISLYYEKNTKETVKDERLVRKIEDEKNEIAKMVKSLDAYKKEVEEEKNRLVLGGDLVSRVIIARDSLNSIIEKQNKLLLKSDSNLDIYNKQIDKLLGNAERIDANLKKFYGKLNNAVKGIIQEIRMSYENERNKINEYQSDLMSIKREVTEMASLAMYSNINRVRTTFSDLVLKADLGIIDVAWEKKQEKTDTILKLRTQRAKEIRALYMNMEDE